MSFKTCFKVLHLPLFNLQLNWTFSAARRMFRSTNCCIELSACMFVSLFVCLFVTDKHGSLTICSYSESA